MDIEREIQKRFNQLSDEYCELLCSLIDIYQFLGQSEVLYAENKVRKSEFMKLLKLNHRGGEESPHTIKKENISMLNIIGRGNVFNVETTEKSVNCNLSTAKKNQDGKYEYMSWRTRFVGKAFEPAKELKDKDRINITSGVIENKYDKAKDKTYYNVSIFEFEKMIKTEQKSE